MKVLLLNPTGSELGSHGDSQIPLGYLYLAKEAESLGHEVKFIDGIVSSNSEIMDGLKWKPDVIGIQCLTIKRKEAFDTVRLAYKTCPTAKIIMGGPHAGSCKDQILEHYDPMVDDICQGEGEKWIKSYLTTGAGTLERYENLDDLPMPAYHLIDFRRYWSHFKGHGLKAWVQFGRGCGFVCEFCSVWRIWKKFRVRSPEHMMEELKYLYYHRQVRTFNFVDDIMTQEREPVMRLCELIIKDGMKIRHHFLTRTDCVDQELLDLLGQSGCIHIDYGIESGHPDILKNIHKQKGSGKDVMEYVRQYQSACSRAIEMTQKAGIRAVALIMIGNRGESFDTIKATRKWLREHKPSSIHWFTGVYLLPKTTLFEKLRKDGAISDDAWLDEKKIHFVPFPKWKLLVWQLMIASTALKEVKRLVINMLLWRKKTGLFRRWLFIQIRKRFL